MFKLETERIFHPVGQGLFASGMFRLDNSKPFRWVYDCGTESERHLLSIAIQKLADQQGAIPEPKLDIVAISHFDRDHINGLVELLGHFKVETLLLPYMPLSQRLLSGFAGNVAPDDSVMQFILRPVSFLRLDERMKIDRIVFVPPGVAENGVPLDSETRRPLEGEQIPIPPIEFEETKDDSRFSDLGITEPEQTKPRIPVRFMKRGTAIRVGGLWEFVPYNDKDENPAPPPDFVKCVEELRGQLLSGATDKDRQDALKLLKDMYDVQFGGDRKQRNIISLFLYSGPTCSKFCCHPRWYRCRYWCIDGNYYSRAPRPRQCCCGTLYTGDGYLNTEKRLMSLIDHFGAERIDRIGCMQVMHHGARANWCPGLAERFHPCVSIFNCNPKHKRYRHPHADVLRDFLRFRPVLVDRENGFICHAHGVCR